MIVQTHLQQEIELLESLPIQPPAWTKTLPPGTRPWKRRKLDMSGLDTDFLVSYVQKFKGEAYVSDNKVYYGTEDLLYFREAALNTLKGRVSAHEYLEILETLR